MILERGILIVFEGIDGTGKSSQCGLLSKSLNEMQVPNIALAEPTRGEWGMKIRRLLKEGRQGVSPEEELSWFINDRKEDVKKNILPALRKNKVVIMDGDLQHDPIYIPKLFNKLKKKYRYSCWYKKF